MLGTGLIRYRTQYLYDSQVPAVSIAMVNRYVSGGVSSPPPDYILFGNVITVTGGLIDYVDDLIERFAETIISR